MRIAAILCVRNDAPYLANCLNHLIDNGIGYAVIDNESDDDVSAILRRPRFREHLLESMRLRFSGRFELARQLELKEAVSARLGADWVIHHDVDEVMHSAREGETLLEAIASADARGFNVVALDEFVFLPVDFDYVPDHAGWQPLAHYYFFRSGSASAQQMRAFKADRGFSITRMGGHTVDGNGVRVSPERLALRHYIVRSQAHAYEKYRSRRYSRAELAKDWHHDRVGLRRAALRLPDPGALKVLRAADDRNLDRTDPKSTHYWQWRSR
jgi:glycosyl transferase family 2